MSNSNNTPSNDVTAKAKIIRATIKKQLGHNAKAVSVRSHRYSMGSSIYVTVNTAAAARDVDAIRDIAQIGTVGYNSFVQVSVSDSAQAELATPELIEAVANARAKLDPTKKELVPVEGTDVAISFYYGFDVNVYVEGVGFAVLISGYKNDAYIAYKIATL
jgi:hypothetical protein